MKTRPDAPNTHHQHSHAPIHKRLVDATHGIWHEVASLIGPDEACDRLLDLGFTPGAEVRIVQSTPLGDPLVVVLRGARLALRKQEAAWITVL
ncbi:MAG: ferrous iron transport protein A [Acidobacteriota bacterium]